MTNPKDSAARTEVGPHNTIGVAMEDLPQAERRAFEKELEEEEVGMFPKNSHGGDQENCPSHHYYGNRYSYGKS
jgi:hypothetical protein